MEYTKTDATRCERLGLLQKLETNEGRAHLRKWLKIGYQYVEAANEAHIAHQKCHVSCMAASGYPREEIELPDRSPLEITWECYVHLIALAEIGIEQ